MASHNHHAVTSSINPNWRTPRWLVSALDREFGIILDAAADRTSRIIPDGHFLGPGSDLLDDALCGVPWWDVVKSVWVGQPHYGAALQSRAIFCNPPYSQKENRPIEPWLKAMADAGQDGTVIGVVPYSQQTEWWRVYVEGHDGDDGQPHSHLKATEVRKFPFRIKFDPPPDYVAPRKTKADGTDVDGKASGANVNTAIVIWRADNGFVEPWTPYARYWVPPEFYDQSRRHRRAEAVPGDR